MYFYWLCEINIILFNKKKLLLLLLSSLTVSQLKCVYDTISYWFENHQPQKIKISNVTNVSFIQNSNQMASRLTAIKFFEDIFSTPAIFKATSKAALIAKTNLTFPAFSLRFEHFAGQFCIYCKFWFHEKRHMSQVGQCMIFLDQTQFFAMHSNQWGSFNLCR